MFERRSSCEFQKKWHVSGGETESGGDGGSEALGNEGALIGVAAAQGHAAEVDGGLGLRDLLFPQAGGLDDGQGLAHMIHGQRDRHRLRPIPAQRRGTCGE